MSEMANVAADVPASLRAMWRENNISPLWESLSARTFGDELPKQPHIWRWTQCEQMIGETAKHSSPELVERRVLLMVDPQSAAVGNDAAVGHLSASYQTLLPGEKARPHRHSMDALRLPIVGSGAETIVDGKLCPMEVGDLILTPGWTWHEHVHTGDEPFIWVDMLNVSLHRALGTDQFQPGPVVTAPVTTPDAAFAAPGLLPSGGSPTQDGYSPLFRYSYADAVRALANAPVSSDGARRVRYANPVTGGPCLALLDCYMMQLDPGQSTRPFRSNASSICVVIDGDGRSDYEDGSAMSWEMRDTFTLPARNAVTHTAGPHGARIFQTTDRVAYQRLGVLMETLVS